MLPQYKIKSLKKKKKWKEIVLTATLFSILYWCLPNFIFQYWDTKYFGIALFGEKKFGGNKGSKNYRMKVWMKQRISQI